MAITPSILVNPLATVEQLAQSASNLDGLSPAIEDSVRYDASQFIQTAANLLRLPQELAAQAIVLLCRFWTGTHGASMLEYDAKDAAAGALYLATKPSGHSISPRLLLTVLDFLFHSSPSYRADTTTWTLSEGQYELARGRLYDIEARMLRVLGFQTYVTIPHALCINYLQALGIFDTNEGDRLAKCAFEYLNTGLFSPQMIYLTHQPNALAVSAIYLAARKTNVKLPEVEWWEVFDVDREDLGFVVVAMQSVQEFVTEERQRQQAGLTMLNVASIKQQIAAEAASGV